MEFIFACIIGNSSIRVVYPKHFSELQNVLGISFDCGGNVENKNQTRS